MTGSNLNSARASKKKKAFGGRRRKKDGLLSPLTETRIPQCKLDYVREQLKTIFKDLPRNVFLVQTVVFHEC